MSTPWPTHKNVQLYQQLNKHIKMVHIRYDTIRYDTIRYDTIRYDTIRYDTILIDTGICFTLACKVIDPLLFFLAIMTLGCSKILKTRPLVEKAY